MIERITALTFDASAPSLWRSINTIRVLAMDAVQRAESGHPGTPMALAPVAWLLWTRQTETDSERRMRPTISRSESRNFAG